MSIIQNQFTEFCDWRTFFTLLCISFIPFIANFCFPSISMPACQPIHQQHLPFSCDFSTFSHFYLYFQFHTDGETAIMGVGWVTGSEICVKCYRFLIGSFLGDGGAPRRGGWFDLLGMWKFKEDSLQGSGPLKTKNRVGWMRMVEF